MVLKSPFSDLKLSWSMKERTWRVAKYGGPRNLCSAFNPSKCTHTAVRSEQTHTPWTHTRSSGQPFLYCSKRGAVRSSVPCSRAPQSWYWGVERALYIHSPCWKLCSSKVENSEEKTRRLRIRSSAEFLYSMTCVVICSHRRSQS